MEGTITVAFGIIAWFFLPGFPDQNTFLTSEETAIVLDRVEKDRGDSLPDVLTTEKILRYLLDWKLWATGMDADVLLLILIQLFWVTGMMYMCATMPAYAIRCVTTSSHLRPCAAVC